jgi:hypothetical protein
MPGQLIPGSVTAHLNSGSGEDDTLIKLFTILASLNIPDLPNETVPLDLQLQSKADVYISGITVLWGRMEGSYVSTYATEISYTT